MIITAENYFDNESNMEYMGFSQYKQFRACEAMAIATLRGDWKQETSDAMLQGSYVHAWNEGQLDQFVARHPEMFKKNGEFKLAFENCNKIIEVIKEDPMFMAVLKGEKEKIFVAEMFGTKWKILIDSYNSEKKRFADLKILRQIKDKFWNAELQLYENVFEYRGYFAQIAIYAEIERIANNRPKDDYFEPFIAVATKEKYPDKAIISFVSEHENYSDFIRCQLAAIEYNMDRILEVKQGLAKPNRCEECDYCKSTKKLTGTLHYSSLALY